MRFHHHLNFWLNYFSRKYPINRVTLNSSEISRVEHYCSPATHVLTQPMPANSVKKTQSTGYSYDWYRIFKSNDRRMCRLSFGDIILEAESPTFTKSRPINRKTRFNNNILLPLDAVRHLTFIEDKISFESKKNNAVWRGAAYQQHRKNFLRKCSNLVLCDTQDTSKGSPKSFTGRPKNYLPYKKQLLSKFIFAIEGNDVASNLKWIMGSNSIPVMPKPRYETWFCEQFLVPGQHYVEIKADFSDIEEVLENYLTQDKLCKEINQEGKLYAEEYKNFDRQFAIAREVAELYFEITT